MKTQIFYSFKFALLIVTATLLEFCLCAPMKKADPSVDSDPWWYSPCTSKIRHSRSTTDPTVPVQRQLRDFAVRLKSAMKKIDNLYNGKRGARGKPKTPNAKLKWLQLKKWTKKIKTSEKKFEDFYEALQYFAATLDILGRVRIQTNTLSVFNQSERDSIYLNITYPMRNLLCEVYVLLNENVTGIPLAKMRIPQSLRKKSLDLTSAHVMDINFFKKTVSFFKRTRRSLFDKQTNNSVKKSVKVNKRQRT